MSVLCPPSEDATVCLFVCSFIYLFIYSADIIKLIKWHCWIGNRELFVCFCDRANFTVVIRREEVLWRGSGAEAPHWPCVGDGTRRRACLWNGWSILGACFAVLIKARMLERVCEIAKAARLECLSRRWTAECVWFSCWTPCSPAAQTQALWRGP